MKSITIVQDEKGVGIEVKGVGPLEAMNLLTVAMVQVLQKIKAPEEKAIIQPNIKQAMDIGKNRLN